jgi:hypothetical protein
MSTETSAILPAKLSALPDSWIEKIFMAMASAYGTLFTDRWRDLDLHAVKGFWAGELASFSDNPECFGMAIKTMLQGCKLPPTLPEFIAICRNHYRRPTEVVAAIEHKLSPEDIERNRERARKIAEALGRKLAA